MAPFLKNVYERLHSGKEAECLDSDEDSSCAENAPSFDPGSSLGYRYRAFLPWILHLLLLTSYTLVFFWLIARSGTSSPCFSEKLLGAPIIWEEHTYLSNIHSNVFDPYSRKNPHIDDAWKAIMNTQMMTITKDEKEKLPGGRDTASVYGGKEYLVIPEVFHQLHCLNALRLGYTKDTFNDTNDGFDEAGGHSDHCFSYLAQTLMCHADVGVMTTTWNEEYEVYTADFNVTKQCRNFDAILHWAQGRRYYSSRDPRVSSRTG